MCKYKVYFDKKIKKDFKKLDKNVLKLLLDWIENNLEKTYDHSNGRWVRNQIDKILRTLAVYMFDNGLEDLNDIPNAIIEQCRV